MWPAEYAGWCIATTVQVPEEDQRVVGVRPAFSGHPIGRGLLGCVPGPGVSGDCQAYDRWFGHRRKGITGDGCGPVAGEGDAMNAGGYSIATTRAAHASTSPSPIPGRSMTPCRRCTISPFWPVGGCPAVPIIPVRTLYSTATGCGPAGGCSVSRRATACRGSACSVPDANGRGPASPRAP
ncbi:hypothetical protein MN0502_18700 [Arthrobacter sp. MN05-02]|nr:hypothetical protein MN0502_18700 [Arthrobacter sp. MN05-02]